jgi:hypothetical protein
MKGLKDHPWKEALAGLFRGDRFMSLGMAIPFRGLMIEGK